MDYHILCIDDDPDFLTGLRFELDKLYRSSVALTLGQGLQIIQRETVDLVLLDVGLGEENGIEGIRQIKRADPSLDVVMVSGFKDAKLIVSAIRAGASDYICKGFEMDELIAIVEKLQRVRQVRNCRDALLSDLKAQGARSRMLGISSKFRDILDKADRLKNHNANILIEGESGTGKELLARYIHNIEGDPHRPFIAVNCAAIPDTLIESELFGHEKGAFTGAIARRIGKFELSNGGDIFLDEISALKPELQAKILRTLQEKEVVRIGGAFPIKVNFRVISATNEDLEQMIASGKFRMDLYHRLCVIRLSLPPLKERTEDIPLLTKHFLDKHSRPGHHKDISPKALEMLKLYRWPGNIRELENLIQNLIIMSPEGTIEANDMPEWVRDVKTRDQRPEELDPTLYKSLTLKECLRRTEKVYIERALNLAKGNRSKTARDLSMSRTTLHARLKELGID